MNTQWSKAARRVNVLAVFFLGMACALCAACARHSSGGEGGGAETPPVSRPVVVYLIVDGLRVDSLWKALASSGEESALVEIFGKGFSRSAYPASAETVFPSMTFPANATLVTGLLPGQHGILGNRWLDRPTGMPRELDAGIDLGNLGEGLGDRWLEEPTIYEEFQGESLVVFHHFTKGAKALNPSLLDASWLAIDPGYFDLLAIKKLLVNLARRGDAAGPQLITLYLPGVDEATHKRGAASQAQFLKESLDGNLKILLEGTGGKKGLKEWAGGMEQISFVLVSDHGASDVYRWIAPSEAKAAVFAALGELHAWSGLEGEALDDCLWLAPNGAMAHLYLRKPGRPWSEPLGGDEEGRAALDAVAKALLRAGELEGKLDGVIASLGPEGYFTYGVGDGGGPVVEPLEDLSGRFAGMGEVGGDLLLLASPAEAAAFLNSDMYGDGAYFATHGNLAPENMRVPLLAAGRNVAPGLIPAPDIRTAPEIVLQLANGGQVAGAAPNSASPSLMASAWGWATVSEPYRWTPVFSNPEGLTLALELVDAPAGMTLSDGVVAWTPSTSDVGARGFALRVSVGGVFQADYPQTLSVRPGEPAAVTAVREGRGVVVGFDAAPGADKYRIYRLHPDWRDFRVFESDAPELTDSDAPCSEVTYLVHGETAAGIIGGQHAVAVAPAVAESLCQNSPAPDSGE